jgi:hypothetical protein
MAELQLQTIHPINLVPGQLQVPKVDTSWLANLYTNYQQSKANALNIDKSEREQVGLAALGKLDPNDPLFAQKAAQIALGLGKVEAASSLLEHGLKRQGMESYRSGGGLLGGVTAAPPAVAPASPGQPPLPPQRPAQTPAAPLVGPTPPLFTRTPNVSTSALPSSDIQPAVAQATPPIMAQAGAPGSNFTGFTTASGRPKVSYEGVSPELLQHANAVGNELYGTLNRPLGITSARDSVHTTGSQHYVGNALDLRTRDLSASQRQAIVASFRAKGLTAVDEGDHIHVAMPRGAAPQPGAAGAPGTVLASTQGRGPISTGAGGAAIASAMPQTPLARTTVAALDPSYAPQTSMTDAGPQLPAGVSPAAPAAQGAAGPPILPSPTPLVPPNISLAALGALPAGGVGTIGPMGGVAGDAMPPQGVQMAQAAQGGQVAPYSPAWPIPSQQGLPALPVRPPVQPAPAAVPRPGVAPQAPPVARGAVSGSPLEHVPVERLVRAATHPYAPDGEKQLALQELKRRSDVQAEQNKTTGEYNNYVRDLNTGAVPPGTTFVQHQQMLKAENETADWRNYRKFRDENPQWQGDFLKYQKESRQPLVTIDQRAEGAQASAIAADEAKAFRNTQNAGERGQAKLTTLGILRNAMKTEGFYSGTGAGAVLMAKQIRSALGLGDNVSDVAAMELFRAYSNKSIMDTLGSLGAGVSNADVSFLGTTASSLDHSEQGNARFIVIQERLAERDRVLAKMARDYRNSEIKDASGNVIKPKGRYDDSFQDVAAEYAEKNPLFKDEGELDREATKILKKTDPNALDAKTNKRLKDY